MAHKGWGALSAGQRGRYERAGVTRSQYESGASLAAARGHAKTPERPERAALPHNTERYREYRERKRQLVQQLSDLKRDLFGNRVGYNPRHKYPQSMSMTNLRRAIKLVQADVDALDRPDAMTFASSYSAGDGPDDADEYVYELLFYH